MTLEEALDKLEKELLRKGSANKTIETYKSRLRSLANYYQNTEIDEISLSQLNTYLNFLRHNKKTKLSTVRASLYAIIHYYNGVLGKDFKFDSIPSHIEYAPQKYLTTEEVKEILNKTTDIKYKLLFAIMYTYGLYLNNALDINKNNIDLKNRTISVRMGRGKKLKKFELPIYIAKELESYFQTNKLTGYLFINERKTRLNSTNANKVFANSLRQAGVRKALTLKTLKNSLIMHLEREGIPLGHILKKIGSYSVPSLLKFSKMNTEEYDFQGQIDYIMGIKTTDVILDRSNVKLEEFIALSRIDELRKIKSERFDLTKLIRLCEEINGCYGNELYFSTGLLIRAILDHVPPIFGANDFTNVISQNGAISFKKQMSHLNTSSRNIADGMIHNQIRSKEVLPNKIQVDFKGDIDVLLQEIIRRMK